MAKKLYRSKDNKIIGGVSAGIGDYFDIDTTLVRLIFVVLLFFNGIGALLYLILMIVTPEKPEHGEKQEDTANENFHKFVHEVEEKFDDVSEKIKEKGSDDSRRNLFALVLIFAGVLIFINQFYPNWLNFEFFWPALLIIAGLFILLKNK